MQQSTLGSNTATGVRESASNVSEKAHAGIDKLTQSAHQTVDRVASAASSAAERYADSTIVHRAQDWKVQACDYVRAHPLASVGMAVAAGFLLSRLTHFR